MSGGGLLPAGANLAGMPEQSKSCLRWYHWALLISIDVLGPFSTDSYIPNMPEMTDEFKTDPTHAGLTIQLNWITKAVFNVVLGKLSDVYGRRPIIIYSFLFYMVGTLGASIAPTIDWFILCRIVQAIGEANDAITSAVARDTIEDPAERMKMLALLGAIRPIAIISAPSVGGVLGEFCGWRNVFRLLFMWGTANMLLTAKLIPETLSRQTTPEHQSRLSWQFRRLFCNRVSCGLMVTFGLLIAGPMTMLSGISFVLEKYYHIKTVLASLLIGTIPVMMIVASGLVGKIAKRVTPLNVMRLGMVVQFLVAAAVYLVAIFISGDWWATECVMYAMVLSQAVVIPPLQTIFLQPLKDIAGLAGGVQTFLQVFMGAQFGLIGSWATGEHGPAGLLLSIGSVLAINQLWFWSLIGFCPPGEVRLFAVGCEDAHEDAHGDLAEQFTEAQTNSDHQDGVKRTISLQPVTDDTKVISDRRST